MAQGAQALERRFLMRLRLAMLVAIVALPAMGQSQQSESVAEAARKAREKRKAAATAKKTFTNDDVKPGAGATAAEDAPKDASTQAAAAAGEAGTAAGTTPQGQAQETPEQRWRKRFAEAREALGNAEKELAILQRELETNRVQYYPDPQKTLEQETLRSDINEKRRKIEAKQKEVADLRQALEDLERQLRAEGGPPGWARP